jgi:hypothetical protein
VTEVRHWFNCCLCDRQVCADDVDWKEGWRFAKLLGAGGDPRDVEGPDCDGYVVHLGNDAVTLVPEGNDVCSPKWVTSINSKFARQILRTCPFGTHCHVEGGYSNHGIEEITRVQRR